MTSCPIDKARHGLKIAALVLALASFAMPALAQHGGGGPGGGGMGGPGGGGMGGPGGGGMGGPGGGGMGGGFGKNGDFGGSHNTPNMSPNSAGASAGPRFSVSLGPTGRWWDDKKFAKKLSLRPDQQQHMDEIFESNKGPVLNSYSRLQQEQSRLDAVIHEDHPDEGRINAQIDRTFQSRAELEKAYAHMMLQIRKEMDAGQLSKLEKAQDQ